MLYLSGEYGITDISNLPKREHVYFNYILIKMLLSVCPCVYSFLIHPFI